MPTSTPTVPELPFADALLDLTGKDIDASRGLVQRLLALGDALLATSVTLTGVFGGLAYANKVPALSLLATPLILMLAYAEGSSWVQMDQASQRIRFLEVLVHSYVVALRETKTVRPQAVQRLSDEIDRYQFGVERTLVAPTLATIWRANRSRLRWWLIVLLAGVLGISAALIGPDVQKRTCLALADGSILSTTQPVSVVQGRATLAACPTLSAPSPQGVSTTVPGAEPAARTTVTSTPGTASVASTSTSVGPGG